MAEKQDKVLNKIKHTTNSGQTTPIGTKPNDECYTSMQDILNELAPWAALDKFRGKDVICPCDWDIVADENIYSIHIIYAENNATVIGNDVQVELGIFADENNPCKPLMLKLKEDEVKYFLRNKLTCNFVRTLNEHAREWGIKSITASGYNPANGKGVPFQEVDYSKYDICVTNPPFSLYNEFMKCIVDNIDFIVLAPFLNRVTPNIGLPLMLKKAYLGFNAGIGDMQFYNPTNENEYKTKTIAVDWITSFSEAQDARNIELENHTTGIDFNLYQDEYAVMENMTMKDETHPIRIPATQIPDNYNGWFFTSIQFLQHYDLRKFEWYGTNFQKYYNSTNRKANPFNHKAGPAMLKLNGKNMFHGIVARRIIREENQTNES